MAITEGTRRRNTVGFFGGSVWSSTSTYKSDLVSSLPARPSNSAAYLLIVLGVCGLLVALMIGSNDDKSAHGLAIGIGLLSSLFVLGGIRVRKPADQLANAQTSWDKRWICARCGHQWEA
jgi:hypothetical protein